MHANMKNQGACRKVFSLSGPPPRTYTAKSSKKRLVVPIFEPYQEALPLEAGYYTFVIDGRGRFRVERGNTSSHAGMVGTEPVGAAGHFVITRAGKVGRVVCTSRDYRICIPDQNHMTVRFVIDAFHRHQAFDVSPHAIFSFTRGLAESFCVSVEGELLEDTEERRRLYEEEGQGHEEGCAFDLADIEVFNKYSPVPPPRLYPMKLDHQNDPLDFDDHEPFQHGPFGSPYSPKDGPLKSGRKAFVLDNNGWLIIGHGHHLLSGGNSVGAAGQVYVDDSGLITEINLNFSGHYRPPLSAEYARFTYRTLINHPLLSFSPDCRISARRFFDLNSRLENITFAPSELLLDDSGLEMFLAVGEDESVVDDEELMIEEEF